MRTTASASAVLGNADLQYLKIMYLIFFKKRVRIRRLHMVMLKSFALRNFSMILKFQKINRKRKPQKYQKYLPNRMIHQIYRQIRMSGEHRINLQKNDVLETL